MPKRTRKLLVYLDQNFLSAMAKADSRRQMNPLFKEIYDLVHQGFLNETLVVPASTLHDIESSLATHLKERIATYQGYLGQIRLRRPEEIWNRQIEAALSGFSGRHTDDPLDPNIAFLDDPNEQVQPFGISIDAHLERFDFRTGRHRTADRLEILASGYCGRALDTNSSLELNTKDNGSTSCELTFSSANRFPMRRDRGSLNSQTAASFRGFHC